MSQFFTELFLSIEKALPILLVIFLVVFFAIILTRLILNFLFERAYKNFLKIKKASKKFFPNKQKKYLKEEDELLRKKFSEIPRANSEIKAELKAKNAKSQSGTYEIIQSEKQEDQELSAVNIVDIVKPIGFWTSMILGQKLTYLIQSAQMLNKRGDKGFWASMIEAKEREAGRQHSRGR